MQQSADFNTLLWAMMGFTGTLIYYAETILVTILDNILSQQDHRWNPAHASAPVLSFFFPISILIPFFISAFSSAYLAYPNQ